MSASAAALAQSPELAANPIVAVRSELAAARERLKAEFTASAGNADPYIRGLCAATDAALRTLWRAAALPSELTLLAVGGYGRGELFPSSDVDILILLPAAPYAALGVQLERFVGDLWDIGIELGHSVRTLEQCAEEAGKDITVTTALREARWLDGSRTLYRRFDREVRAGIDPQTFLAAKRLEQAQRHTKYQDTPYSLEPNLKESPGGLRDLHVIRWVASACGVGDRWTDLAKRGFVTPEEARQLRKVERTLNTLRVRLHLTAARREDRILFDYQSALAAQYGFTGDAGKRASEELMQVYYRTAKSITQLNEIVLQNLAESLVADDAPPPAPINERFQAVYERLDARDPDLFEREPAAILESFLLLQQHAELKGMSARTLRAIWRARKRIDAKFRRDPANRERFLALLQQPRGIVHEFRRMNQYGILGRYLPAFRRIVGQMQHDLFHVYTVDQHILMVMRNLRRFTMLEFSHEYPECTRLIANFDRHWLLYVAAIFHDIAKGRGGDHSKLGRVDAQRFCRDHGLSREDTELVVFLVEHHLTMSTVAQKQDLSDPDVIQAFTAVVQTERRLIALYLLTVADIRGTSPKVWNAWKGKLLADLYRQSLRTLRGSAGDRDTELEAKRAEALRLLRLYALSDTAKDALWNELDVAYFLRHDAQEIAWQTRGLHYRVNATEPVVRARLAPIGEGVQVMIYIRDQKDLFARICAYFAGAFGGAAFNVVDAKVHTTRHGYALDTFLVMPASGDAVSRELLSLIEHDLAEHLARASALPDPTRGRISRRLKHQPIQPSVDIRPDERGQYHLLAMTAGDRPGLLYAIAHVLARYDISLHTAKIVTLGERAEDVFVIGGESLERPRLVLQLETELVEALA